MSPTIATWLDKMPDLLVFRDRAAVGRVLYQRHQVCLVHKVKTIVGDARDSTRRLDPRQPNQYIEFFTE
jgi:hypothetical protein